MAQYEDHTAWLHFACHTLHVKLPITERLADFILDSGTLRENTTCSVIHHMTNNI